MLENPDIRVENEAGECVRGILLCNLFFSQITTSNRSILHCTILACGYLKKIFIEKVTRVIVCNRLLSLNI